MHPALHTVRCIVDKLPVPDFPIVPEPSRRKSLEISIGLQCSVNLKYYILLNLPNIQTNQHQNNYLNYFLKKYHKLLHMNL